MSRNRRLARLYAPLRTGLWFVPTVFVVAALLAATITVAVDRHFPRGMAWLAFGGGPSSAQQILTTIATTMLTFTGAVFTVTIVALQLASSQFSPRVLRSFLRDRANHVVLGVFASTFVFSLAVLTQVRTGAAGSVFVPGVSVTVALATVVVSVLTFVYFVNHVAQSIRVVNIIESVTAESRVAFDDNYPASADASESDAAGEPGLGVPDRHIAFAGRSGVVTRLDIAGLVEIAAHHDCVLTFLPHMGDFVVEGAPVFAVHGLAQDLSDGDVLGKLGLSPERDPASDPAYGIRQLVDIAERALSPAINDPTTAVQAFDRVHELLCRVGPRPQPSGVHRDRRGDVRLVHTVRSWSGLVSLAFEEIRHYGSSSVQIHRRLRASIDDLIVLVPAHREPPLRRQLRLIQASADRSFPDLEERALAVEPDESGLGNEENEPAGH